MTSIEMLEAGRLAQAIEQVKGELRSQPADLHRRTVLFELLCFAGDRVGAQRQLDFISHRGTGAGTVVGVQVYRNLLEAESARHLLFASGVRPRFLLAPPPGITRRLEALDRLREGRAEDARALLEEAAADARPLRGTAHGEGFEDFRDADDLLAPVLEVYAADRYYWVPWEQVQFLKVPPPRSLRDLLWTPAQLATFDGQLGEVFLPALYPGSDAHPDEAVRLGRKTEWLEPAPGIVRGAGLKLFLVGDDARSLPELGELQFPLPDTPTLDGPG
ncbi:MAG TPA: type VI secretion system accessory protein TagJ [Isosphaeraceae bacterium]|jgi:type VI secretion system protein ImpE